MPDNAKYITKKIKINITPPIIINKFSLIKNQVPPSLSSNK